MGATGAALLGIARCSSVKSSTTSNIMGRASSQQVSAEEQSSASSESTDEQAGENSTAATRSIEWATYTYTDTDSDGYSFEITYKVSTWIFLSNTELLNEAWNESGGQGSIPSAESWGLARSDNA